MEMKYNKFLTVLLVLIIVGIIGLLGFLGYRFLNSYKTANDADDYVSTFVGEDVSGQKDSTTRR